MSKIEKVINHVRRWNIWRKHNADGKIHKFIVLIGLIKSPTFGTASLPEEMQERMDDD